MGRQAGGQVGSNLFCTHRESPPSTSFTHGAPEEEEEEEEEVGERGKEGGRGHGALLGADHNEDALRANETAPQKGKVIPVFFIQPTREWGYDRCCFYYSSTYSAPGKQV